MMKRWFKKVSSVSDQNKSRPLHTESPPDPTSVVRASVPITAAPPPDSVDSQDTSLSEDLWKSAYDQLDPAEQDILSKAQASAKSAKGNENPPPTRAIVDEVIQITEEQYKKYQQGGITIRRSTGEEIDLRKLSRQILNAALSFKDVITAVVALDPTRHAASAWAVVSLGLTMTQNRLDLRDALFESSEYLADILARCAYIEQTFYRHNSKEKSEIGRATIGVYGAILRYAAELLAAQHPSIGKRMLTSVTSITNQHLTELRSSIEEAWQKLCQWVQFDALDTLLQNGKEAESRLARIDAEISEYLQLVIRSFSLPTAEGAAYDSYADQHDSRCLLNTRVELLNQISAWAEDPGSKHIFWLNGMAGTGKSTVARTVAHAFQLKGQLGASFFFKKGEADRESAKRFIPTIAEQLITSNPQLAAGVLGAIKGDPKISSKALSQQFETLLLQPLLNVPLCQNTNTIVVIDALDECEAGDIQILLQLLPQLQKSESIRLRIFLTSRPELPVREYFEQNGDHQGLVLHEIRKTVIEQDIRLFLQSRFASIKKQRNVLGDWPGGKAIDILVEMSVPLFIFAATICRFVDQDHEIPEDRLKEVLNNREMASSSQMERIYLPVLKHQVQKSNGLMKDFHGLIGVIILLAAPLSVKSLSRLIDMPERKVVVRLGAFHSVLSVPKDNNAPIRILHLSFREFLVKTESVFHVDEKVTHGQVLSHCLRVMRSGLKHNICGLSSYGTQQEDINSQAVAQHIPQDLQYSCRYWAYHLTQSESYSPQMEGFAFLKKHFLHWLEAMSLLGIASESLGIINGLQSGLGGNGSIEFRKFLQDATRFLLKNIQLINNAPLQVYCSGLVFSPTDSIIRRTFEGQRPSWIPVLPQVEKSWSAELQTLEGHSDVVTSVAFSSDGQRIVSGSNDHTIKLWDAQTGAELRTFEGHSYRVTSVAFSPDGQRIVSGSGDHTIKLWDAQTGAELRALKGHSYWVTSVAFSPDGQRIVSGSVNHTIKLWDAQTGAELRTLEGHSDWVTSVAFSSDGQRIVSGSKDNTIKLWDSQTGAELRTLEGHSNSVTSVAFSQDGQRIVSGSRDNTIKLWDAQTGAELRTLEGHSKLVYSVAFSSDGQRIVSGSGDNTIKLWDAQIGAELRTLKGHSNSVTSVAFSPDGQRIVSGSRDNTIKLWDAQAGAELRTLKGHSGWVTSVAFSSDAQRIVSGSRDNTIKLWDSQTGAELRTLEGHSDWVTSVAFSPDGQRIVSGSRDNTIKLWDSQTGAELRTLEGHSNLVTSVAFLSDGQRIVSGSDDHTIKLWDAQTGAELRTLEGHSKSVYSVAFSPDGQRIVSRSDDHTIKLWDTQTGAELRTLDGYSNSVSNVSSGNAHIENEQSSRISVEIAWVCFRGERVIWLTPELRRSTCHDIRHDILALGCRDGRVFIIRFCAPSD